MTRRIVVSTLAVALLITSLVLVAPTTATQKGGSVKQGSIGDGQSFAALKVQNQSADDDAWKKYVEFTPGTTRHISVINHSFTATEITSKMRVDLNYRGPAADENVWKLQVRNSNTGKWNTVWRNDSVTPWTWDADGVVLKKAKRFVNANNKVRLRWRSSNAVDVAQLDYLAVSFVGGAAAPTPEPTPAPDLKWIPPQGTSWDWVLGAEPSPTGVHIYDIDGFDATKASVAALQETGGRVICYINVGTWENWRPDKADFPESVIGNPWDDWPGERFLDIRQLDILGPLMGARMDMCATKGFDAIEADVMDSYGEPDSGFPLTAAHQLTYNKMIADLAHERGLAIALKNDPEQAKKLEPWFDFAITEDCFADGWCADMAPFYENGKAVLAAEYTDNLGPAPIPQEVCEAAAESGISVILKDRDLTNAVFAECS